MPSLQSFGKTFLMVAVSVAIINRVPQIRNIVAG